MNTREFSATGKQVSEVGIGTWQLGGSEWGDVPDDQALTALQAAADAGITFIDTADIYGLGRSETLIGKFLQQRPDRDRFFIATKLGRHPEPGWPDNFSKQAIIDHTDASLRRLGVDVIDLTQTHCIPPDVMKKGEVYETLDQLRQQGKIRAFGASVESMDEALDCLEIEGMASLQIIFNIFRQKPIDVLFEKAQEKKVSLIARVPLASGLLAGKFDQSTQFDEKDHRHFNCDGQAFNVGETFAGVPFDKGLELTQLIADYVPGNTTMATWALRWILDYPAITTVIPGARNRAQAVGNAAASSLKPLSDDVHDKLRELYLEHIADHVRGLY